MDLIQPDKVQPLLLQSISLKAVEIGLPDVWADFSLVFCHWILVMAQEQLNLILVYDSIQLMEDIIFIDF